MPDYYRGIKLIELRNILVGKFFVVYFWYVCWSRASAADFQRTEALFSVTPVLHTCEKLCLFDDVKCMHVWFYKLYGNFITSFMSWVAVESSSRKESTTVVVHDFIWKTVYMRNTLIYCVHSLDSVVLEISYSQTVILNHLCRWHFTTVSNLLIV